MTMVAEDSVLDVPSLIDAVNAALEIGDWAQVVAVTVPLYSAAISVGDNDFAELVQDLHWIANDALARPLEIARLVQA
jgi:hypothetical protein